jgi:hypothetical protein
MFEIERVEAGSSRKGHPCDKAIRYVKTRCQAVRNEQAICTGEVRGLGPKDFESDQKSPDFVEIASVAAIHHQLHRNYSWNREMVRSRPLQPRPRWKGSAQAINQDIGVNQIHPAGRPQPSERSFRANSTLSVMSARSRHIPKNSLFNRSRNVVEVSLASGGDDDTVTTSDALPVGTSSGRVIRSSRLGGISASKLMLFVMRPSPYATIAELIRDHNCHRFPRPGRLPEAACQALQSRRTQ